MADEPRRSGRATKGQHHKDKDAPEDTPKQKGKAKNKKGKNEPEPEPEEEEEEYIRCVCGLYEEEEDSPRSMICCDNCSAWQHNDCMGLPEGYEPEKYFCEQCRPNDHKELVAAIKRGEKPWEEVARRREQAEAEKASKKKGKKARKSGTSAPASDAQRTPTLEPEEPAASRKRKLEDTPTVEDKSKRARGSKEDTNGSGRKASQTPAKPSPQPEGNDVAKDVKELPAARKKVAQSLQNTFQHQAAEAVKAGTIKLSAGETAQSLGTRISLQVEHALYTIHAGGEGEPNQSYKDQSWILLPNTKRNPALFQRLANGQLLATELAKMQPEDMASEEKKQEEAELRKKLEKQHVMVEQDGPRIRRTHKGDEYVDEARQVAAESTTPNVPVRKESAVEQDTEMKSPVAASPTAPQPIRKASSASKGALFGDPRRKSSSNFNIDKVWSGVQGSPSETDAPKLVPQLSSPQPAAATIATATADPDVDNLLKDEDAESEPYSPKEYTEDGVVWRGRINGGSLGTFTTVAKFAAGCQPDAENLRMSWNDIIPSEIKLHGRIQPSKADDYLCGLQYSNTTELVIVSVIEPKSPQDQEQFEKFFSYLKTKDRYGVGMQHQVPAIKDIYLLPMEVGQALPTVMKALEHNFPDPVQERSFLVPVVIKWTELPHNAERVQQLRERESQSVMSPSVQPPVAQTPITPHEQFVPQFPHIDGAQGQIVNGAGQGGFPPQQQANLAGHFRSPPPQHGQALNAPGPAAALPPANAAGWAQKLLGPELASCPSVKQLIAQAPNAGEQEFTVIRECLLENSEAAHSLALLTNMLQGKHHARRESSNKQEQTQS